MEGWRSTSRMIRDREIPFAIEFIATIYRTFPTAFGDVDEQASEESFMSKSLEEVMFLS